jgi:predicted transglutaminase-like cysteine proteinase
MSKRLVLTTAMFAVIAITTPALSSQLVDCSKMWCSYPQLDVKPVHYYAGGRVDVFRDHGDKNPAHDEYGTKLKQILGSYRVGAEADQVRAALPDLFKAAKIADQVVVGMTGEVDAFTTAAHRYAILQAVGVPDRAMRVVTFQGKDGITRHLLAVRYRGETKYLPYLAASGDDPARYGVAVASVNAERSAYWKHLQDWGDAGIPVRVSGLRAHGQAPWDPKAHANPFARSFLDREDLSPENQDLQGQISDMLARHQAAKPEGWEEMVALVKAAMARDEIAAFKLAHRLVLKNAATRHAQFQISFPTPVEAAQLGYDCKGFSGAWLALLLDAGMPMERLRLVGLFDTAREFEGRPGGDVGHRVLAVRASSGGIYILDNLSHPGVVPKLANAQGMEITNFTWTANALDVAEPQQ